MKPLDGYPATIGYHMESIFPHAGPSSYTQVTAGTAPAVATGGDSVQALEGGLKLFESVMNGVSDTGNFEVLAIPQARSDQTGQQTLKYTLKWMALVTATIGGKAQTAGTEAAAATDLSAETVRLTAFGYK